MLAYVFWPFTWVVGISDPMLAAKAVSVGIAEVFLPATVAAGSEDLVLRLVVGVVSVSSIVFFSALVPCVLATRIPLTVGRLVVIWFQRVILSILIAGPLAYLLVGLPERDLAAPNLPLVFACAMVAICAMILPGISGAFLLLVFGIYDATLQALREVHLTYIAVFAAGAALGLGLFARLLDTLLARQHDLTMAALVGFMVGALRALWPWLDDERGLLLPPADASAVGVGALALAEFSLVTALVALARRRSGAAERLSA